MNWTEGNTRPGCVLTFLGWVLIALVVVGLLLVVLSAIPGGLQFLHDLISG